MQFIDTQYINIVLKFYFDIAGQKILQMSQIIILNFGCAHF